MTSSATVLSSAPLPTARTSRWAVDAAHTTVGFSVRHMMITNVRGSFGKVEGMIIFDPTSPEASEVTATIELGSIDTRDEKRDAHLRSADFFDAEHHPSMSFASRSVRRKDAGYEIVGELVIRGTKREVTLAVEDVTAEHADPWGNRRIGASAKTRIRRSDFGMVWNTALEAGGLLVGDEVTIQIDVSLVRQG